MGFRHIYLDLPLCAFWSPDSNDDGAVQPIIDFYKNCGWLTSHLSALSIIRIGHTIFIQFNLTLSGPGKNAKPNKKMFISTSFSGYSLADFKNTYLKPNISIKISLKGYYNPVCIKNLRSC